MTDILNAAIALGLLTAGVWAIRRGIRHARQAGDYRTRGDKRAAWRPLHTDPPVIETAPGSNSDDLDTCLNILAATETARKEKP